ncbi:response regulator [Pararhodobacter sp.]|uniref:response regulator n=1 Tax=Pararhodobacter sp. TaxID=2127056 RepID=UPI002AFE04AB|nr:response regulator [Pararhodobacter sp.]
MPEPTPAPLPIPVPFAAVGTGFAISPRTMLLVEDSRLAAEAVRLICRRAGIRLRRAETLAAAAMHLKVYRPDIVLIDLGLPDGSGLDLIAALAVEDNRTGRIVAISGDPTLERAARAAGADAFLLKPVSMTQHLTALTGADVHPNADLPAIDRSLGLHNATMRPDRNSGADPLALRDDLRMVRDLLLGPSEPERLRYAGQFLASVGRSLHDDDLAQAAQSAGAQGDRRALVALVKTRELVDPPI